MDNPVAANVLGTMGAVLWSLQLLPQIWKNYRRHSTKSLSTTFFLAWAIAGVPLGVYNIAESFNVALQVQPNILIFLSLVTWSQCKYYGDKWTLKRVGFVATTIAVVLGGIEAGLFYGIRTANDRGQDWAAILMASLAAALLAGGVLRHYLDMFRTKSDAGLSLRFAILDASGDVVSLLSVGFQPTIDVLGVVVYATELGVWIGLMVIVLWFRVVKGRRDSNIDESEEGDHEDRTDRDEERIV
ncbi:PQ-loop repeat-containing protein [Aspergillus stella-maris]|uniref:PQ-loop repeat-containing protein n=1 Tax=Aspergillus stella-maris TaxID=1810926 RepID=UPI003CCD684E